jgi:hypothetical protein
MVDPYANGIAMTFVAAHVSSCLQLASFHCLCEARPDQGHYNVPAERGLTRHNKDTVLTILKPKR